MQFTVVLSLAVVLGGALAHHQHYLMRRQSDVCEECTHPYREAFYDSFRTTAAAQDYCQVIQTYIDCMADKKQCPAYADVPVWKLFCQNVDGLVAASQCLGGDKGFKDEADKCNKDLELNTKDPMCNWYPKQLECILEVVKNKCPPAAAETLSVIRDSDLKALKCV